MGKKKLSRLDLQKMKTDRQTAVWITAYDFWTATFAEQAGMDMILVGDSLGMCIYGYEGTVPVTMDQCIYHSEAVRRGAPHTFIIGDMPFLSYQVSVPDAVRNAGRFFKEAGVDAIKLEGGQRVCPQIKAIADGGMLVMGHIGLTPQSSGQLGGFKAQGKTAAAAKRMVEDASMLQDAGCFSLVLESVPARLAELVSKRLSIPTIGIGAGVGCDGQVLVTHDLLGLFDRFTPRFVKKYADLHGEMQRAFREYIADVEGRAFPGEEHSVAIDENQWQQLLAELDPT